MSSLWTFWLNHQGEVLQLTLEHLAMVLLSVGAAAAVGIPTGIYLLGRPRLERAVMGAVNVVQTIPSLALFGFLIPLPYVGGIGVRTAVVALFLYALLPILRNTLAGLKNLDPAVREAAVALGLSRHQQLWKVEIPLALSTILAGVRVAAITSVGIATIAAAIGAGGLGMYIFRGVASVNTTLILAGSIPAALLALLTDWLLGRVERSCARG